MKRTPQFGRNKKTPGSRPVASRYARKVANRYADTSMALAFKAAMQTERRKDDGRK